MCEIVPTIITRLSSGTYIAQCQGKRCSSTSSHTTAANAFVAKFHGAGHQAVRAPGLRPSVRLAKPHLNKLHDWEWEVYTIESI